jgi:hypothetical protein
LSLEKQPLKREEYLILKRPMKAISRQNVNLNRGSPKDPKASKKATVGNFLILQPKNLHETKLFLLYREKIGGQFAKIQSDFFNFRALKSDQDSS